MRALLLALLMMSPVSAATFTLGWDANPASDLVTQYTLYEYVGAQWTKVISVPGTETQVTLMGVPQGTHKYAVTAKNIVGESLLSASLRLHVRTNGRISKI
jgi:hypothetical protein